jgi:hypothetical protein
MRILAIELRYRAGSADNQKFAVSFPKRVVVARRLCRFGKIHSATLV